MCQATVYVVTSDGKEEVMRRVTRLVPLEGAVQLETFFDEPRTIPGRVAEIDFLRHTVMLAPIMVAEERR